MTNNIKITYLCHACLLIEISGIKILTDPWLVGPCWANNIWQYPPSKVNPEDIDGIDYFYISHGHEDHLHSETLRRIDKRLKSKAITLAPDFGKPYLRKALKANGLDNIVLIENGQSIDISKNIKLTLYNCDSGDDDSSLLIETKEGNIFLQTDNLMSINLASLIGSNHSIDLAFIMTSRTGIFPGFYENNPKEIKDLSTQKSLKSYEIALEIISGLKVKNVVPYASDLCYLGDLYYMNYFHRKSKIDFVDYVRKNNSDINPIIMGPNDHIYLNKGKTKLESKNNHDFNGKELPIYAYKKRNDVYKYLKEENKYLEKNLHEDLKIFVEKFNKASEKWKDNKFSVLWVVDTIEQGIIYFEQCLPGKMTFTNDSLKKDYDLKIRINSNRLQRLVKGDYKMGIMTLHNGGIICDRGNKNHSRLESYFWDWAYLESRFNVKNKIS